MKQEPYDGRHFGLARWDDGVFGRHRHAFGYVCIVLRGRFTEAGDVGRFRAEPGDVLIHRPYEAHLDLLSTRGADLLNLPLTEDFPSVGRIRIEDPDRVARLAERDPFAAAQAAVASHQVMAGELDWPDLLAADLRADAASRSATGRGATASRRKRSRAAFGKPMARLRSAIVRRRARGAPGTPSPPPSGRSSNSPSSSGSRTRPI